MPTVTDADRINVLFLCTGNSARSIMAEAILDRLAPDRFRAFSAGSHPAGAINPDAAALLEAYGYDTAHLHSKSWDRFAVDDAPRIDIVITVCADAAGESCPVWRGAPATIHWALPDPARVTGSDDVVRAAFERTHESLRARLARLATLPVEDFAPRVITETLERLSEPFA